MNRRIASSESVCVLGALGPLGGYSRDQRDCRIHAIAVVVHFSEYDTRSLSLSLLALWKLFFFEKESHIRLKNIHSGALSDNILRHTETVRGVEESWTVFVIHQDTPLLEVGIVFSLVEEIRSKSVRMLAILFISNYVYWNTKGRWNWTKASSSASQVTAVRLDAECVPFILDLMDAIRIEGARVPRILISIFWFRNIISPFFFCSISIFVLLFALVMIERRRHHRTVHTGCQRYEENE